MPSVREGYRFYKSGKQLFVIVLSNRSVSTMYMFIKFIPEDHYAVHADRNYIFLSYHTSGCTSG